MLDAGHCAYLGVPLGGPGGAPLGALAVYAREPRQWREEEIDAMLALGASTSAALSNAQLYHRVALGKDAPEHESSPPRNTTGSMRKQMMRALAAIKPGFIHIRAFMADSSAISAFSLGWSSTPAA